MFGKFKKVLYAAIVLNIALVFGILFVACTKGIEKESSAFSDSSSSSQDPEIPEVKPNTVLRFIAMSDVHINSADTTNIRYNRFCEAMADAYEIAESDSVHNKLDALVVAGDMVDSDTEENLNLFKKGLETSVREETQSILVMGNHEYFTRDGYEISQTRWKSILGTEFNSHIEINGYHFIGVSPSSDVDYTPSIEWVRQELAKAAADSGDKPIFFIQHIGNVNTVMETGENDNSNNSTAAFADILKEYPQIVNITGHTHCPINDPRSVWQGDYTAVNCGTFAYFCLTDEYTLDSLNSTKAAQFWLIEVYDDGSVRFRPYDVLTHNFFNEGFTVEYPVNKADFEYTDSRFENTKPPVFPDNASVKVLETYGTSVRISFPQATDRLCCVGYEIEIGQGETVVDTQYIDSQYYLYDAALTLTARIGNLRAETEYTVAVRAINAAGDRSEMTLFKTFTTAEKGANTSVFFTGEIDTSFNNDNERQIVYLKTSLSSTKTLSDTYGDWQGLVGECEIDGKIYQRTLWIYRDLVQLDVGGTNKHVVTFKGGTIFEPTENAKSLTPAEIAEDVVFIWDDELNEWRLKREGDNNKIVFTGSIVPSTMSHKQFYANVTLLGDYRNLGQVYKNWTKLSGDIYIDGEKKTIYFWIENDTVQVNVSETAKSVSFKGGTVFAVDDASAACNDGILIVEDIDFEWNGAVNKWIVFDGTRNNVALSRQVDTSFNTAEKPARTNVYIPASLVGTDKKPSDVYSDGMSFAGLYKVNKETKNTVYVYGDCLYISLDSDTADSIKIEAGTVFVYGGEESDVSSFVITDGIKFSWQDGNGWVYDDSPDIMDASVTGKVKPFYGTSGQNNKRNQFYIEISLEDNQTPAGVYGSWNRVNGELYVDGALWKSADCFIDGAYLQITVESSASKVTIKKGTVFSPVGDALSVTDKCFVVTETVSFVWNEETEQWEYSPESETEEEPEENRA